MDYCVESSRSSLPVQLLAESLLNVNGGDLCLRSHSAKFRAEQSSKTIRLINPVNC